MKTSRQRILEYIQDHRAVTSTELRQALKTTEANVRHHLGILMEQELVAVIGSRAGGGRGRPARIYGLSERSQGHNLHWLANALLDEVAAGFSPEQKRQLLERLAHRISASLQAETAAEAEADSARSSHLTRRLNSTVAHLNQAHYQARWEAHPEAPRLILGHCPFRAILAGHPDICLLDAQLLSDLVGKPVEQLKRLATDPRGAPYCMFRI